MAAAAARGLGSLVQQPSGLSSLRVVARRLMSSTPGAGEDLKKAGVLADQISKLVKESPMVTTLSYSLRPCNILLHCQVL